MTHFIDKIYSRIKDFLFTVRCPYCGKVIEPNKKCCDKCKKEFPKFPFVRYATGGYICTSPFPYDGIFRKAVLNFKFHNCGAYAELLSYEMVRAIKDVYSNKGFDIVTCVPMHKDTLKERGFNQAELLARECAALLGMEYGNLLVKTKKNKTQHSIKAAERAKNVIGVYSPIDRNLIKGKRILIIDDIITTGSTLGECARILNKCKCGEICCCTLCTSLLL